MLLNVAKQPPHLHCSSGTWLTGVCSAGDGRSDMWGDDELEVESC